MADFTMPSLGADMSEGTLLEWLVKPGDTVHRGDVVAVVDTAKAAVEVESFADGVVTKLLVEPGTTVPVGQVLATLGDGAKPHRGTHKRAPARPAAASPAPAPAPTPAPAHAPEPVPALVPETASTGRVLATPRARRLAEELGVDLASLAGIPHKPLRAEDVREAADKAAEKAVGKAASQPGPDREQAPQPEHAPQPERAPRKRERPATVSGPEAMRSAIATLMSRSNREIPHYHLATTVDLSRALAWLHEHNRTVPIADRLVPAALLLKATALAAQAAPAMNGFWVDDAYSPAPQVHLGIAISLRGGGLVAPALHNAADLPVDDLMHLMRDLVTRARGGRLRSSELTDSTITVTNLGEQGVELVHGVIYPPQVALIGFGRIVDRPWAVDGLLGVRPLTTLTLAGDHRASDGFAGARFLADIDQRLQHPEDL